jgi:hypothetical protein
VRLLVTGADSVGRSYLDSVSEIPGDGTTTLFEAIDWPPVPLSAQDAAFSNNSPAPGTLAWRMASFPSGLHIPSHFTTSVDLDHIVSGTVTLGLDDGEHELSQGDCVVVRGVGHSWAAGPDGVTMLVTRIGTAGLTAQSTGQPTHSTRTRTVS